MATTRVRFAGFPERMARTVRRPRAPKINRAATNSSWGAAQTLLQMGVDPNSRDKKGKLPIDHAREVVQHAGDLEIWEQLLSQ